MLSKFEKARNALMDSLRRVEDIVPQSIGCQVIVLQVPFFHFLVAGNCNSMFVVSQILDSLLLIPWLR